MTAPLNKQGWAITSVLGALADTRLSMVRGDTELLTLTVLLPDGVTPLDLTGATIALSVKNTAGYVIQAAQTTVTILNAAGGIARIQCTPAQQTAASVTAQVANYTIRVTLASGIVSDQVYGTFVINSTAF